ncbi:MAG TPA: nuclear transport factor 2 family protein [Acidobacteriota bacterium]|nr:nuclear transport factor 2 family protein [Acidobacteriota bacterium]
MRRIRTWLVSAALLATGVTGGVGASGGRAAAATNQELADQVRAAETAFAKSMADRKFDAFIARLADETIFFGGKGAIRGKDAVIAAWKKFYEGPKAPFSWEPTTVEVLDSGTLGLTAGPVRDPEGNQIAVFQSIWRLESDGQWRIIFDRGCDYCPPPPPEKKP